MASGRADHTHCKAEKHKIDRKTAASGEKKRRREEVTRGAKARTALRGVGNERVENKPRIKHCPPRMISAITKDISCGWLKVLVPRVSPIHHGTKGFISEAQSPLQLHHIHITLGPDEPLDSLELIMARRGERAHGFMSHYASWQRVEFHYSVPLVRPSPTACRHTRTMHTAANSLHFRQRRTSRA